MNYIVIAYCIYLPVTLLLTYWVARALFKNGNIFLVDIFHGNSALAESVNKLLLVGFYLINIGYAVFTLKAGNNIGSIQELFELLSKKVGFIILILGGMHFLNLAIFFKLRKAAKTRQEHLSYLERV